MLSDRDLLLALFNAVGSLSESLTGKQALFCIRDSEGNSYHVYPDTSGITYTQVGAADQNGDCQEPQPMHCVLHGT